jgi:hypothetical protein
MGHIPKKRVVYQTATGTNDERERAFSGGLPKENNDEVTSFKDNPNMAQSAIFRLYWAAGECEFIPRMTERFRLWICMSFRSRQVGFDPLGIAFSRFATMLWPGIFDLDRPLGLLC